VDSERCIFTDENDIAAPEVELGMLWFTKLGYGWARRAFFVSARIYCLAVPLGI